MDAKNCHLCLEILSFKQKNYSPSYLVYGTNTRICNILNKNAICTSINNIDKIVYIGNFFLWLEKKLFTIVYCS